jgi:ATP adenylyltransferase
MEQLHAPWRMDYIRSLDKPAADECFLCAAAKAAPAAYKNFLVLWTTPQTLVCINKFPYTNGHLLVAPKAHKADLESLDADELIDLQRQSVEAIRLLKRAISPQGFNLGVNLGRCAGAGLPGHLHQHVVPRWNGDTNFISVVGEVRIVPQAVSQLYDELVRVRSEM